MSEIQDRVARLSDLKEPSASIPKIIKAGTLKFTTPKSSTALVKTTLTGKGCVYVEATTRAYPTYIEVDGNVIFSGSSGASSYQPGDYFGPTGSNVNGGANVTGIPVYFSESITIGVRSTGGTTYYGDSFMFYTLFE